MATRRRTRRNRRTSVFSMLILEGATLLGIVALAQPSWSGRLIEAVSMPNQAATSVQRPVVQQPMRQPAVHQVFKQPPQSILAPAPQAGPVSHYAQQTARPTYSFETYH